MESKKQEAAVQIIEKLKASKKEMESHHATLGYQISTLDSRISTLESLLTDYAPPRISQFAKTTTSPPDDSPATLNLTVVGQDGSVFVFRMKRCNPLRQIMNRWCVLQHQQLTDVVVLYKGRFLRADRTPEQLEMKDGDEIRVENRWV